jgi:hypothetical protein
MTMEKPNQTNPSDPIEAFEPARILQKKIIQKGYLRTAQITDHLKIEFPTQIVLNSFKDNIVGFGSCFAINLKQALSSYFPHFYFERPISAHYSAESIASLMQVLAGERSHTKEEISALNDQGTDAVAHQYFRLRRLGQNAMDQLEAEMKRLDESCLNAVKHAHAVIITLGTSRVLRLRKNGSLIATLVGLIDEPYDTELLSVDQNIAHLETMIRCIRKIRGGVGMPKIIFTVSPQRYNWSLSVMERNHGFFEHNLSKSILRVALDQFIQRHQALELYYFPSFEIAIDELRLFDSMCHYDHLHINDPLTPRYIAKRFIESSVNPALIPALTVIENFHTLCEELNNLFNSGADSQNPLVEFGLKTYLQTVKEHTVLKDHPTFLPLIYDLLFRLKRFDIATDLAIHYHCPKSTIPKLVEGIHGDSTLRRNRQRIKALHLKLQEQDVPSLDLLLLRDNEMVPVAGT